MMVPLSTTDKAPFVERLLGTAIPDELKAELLMLFREEQAAAYSRGLEAARKLLRIQLNLAVPEDLR